MLVGYKLFESEPTLDGELAYLEGMSYDVEEGLACISLQGDMLDILKPMPIEEYNALRDLIIKNASSGFFDLGNDWIEDDYNADDCTESFSEQ